MCTGNQLRNQAKYRAKIKNEDNTQQEEATAYAKRFANSVNGKGLGKLEYTNRNGKVTTVELNEGKNGILKRSYNSKVTKYAEMSVDELEKALKKQKEKGDEGYWIFTRQSASRGENALNAQLQASEEAKAIEQVLKRKKKK